MAPKKVNLKKYHIDCLHSVHDMIVKNPAEHIPLKKLSLAYGIDKKLLTSGFKYLFGKGVYELQMNLRIKLAMQLLAENDKQVKHIAVITGYSSASSFIAAFKTITGYTPKEWKDNGCIAHEV